MAKDPAFLFYPGDWLGGTMGMTFEEKGAYFELLVYQFNNGKFTEAQAKQVLSICSASVLEVVLQKFSKEGDYFYSKRLSIEIEKRKRFAESRRNNAKSKKPEVGGVKAYAQHMENRNENENTNKEYGPRSENYVIVKADLQRGAFRINGVDGLREFFESMGSVLNAPALGTKFMTIRRGKMFNDPQHVWNDYNAWVEKQFK